MNQHNFEYLKKVLANLGFGESLNSDLDNLLQSGLSTFRLNTSITYANSDKVNYALEFKRSRTSDIFFCNRYRATLMNETDGELRSHVFYVTKMNGVHAKAAYNLLSGRAILGDVQSQGSVVENWLQLNFTEQDKSGNYKINLFRFNEKSVLERALSNLPLKENETDEGKLKLISSIQQGDLEVVHATIGNLIHPFYIEFNPETNSFKLTEKLLSDTNQIQGNSVRDERKKQSDKTALKRRKRGRGI